MHSPNKDDRIRNLPKLYIASSRVELMGIRSNDVINNLATDEIVGRISRGEQK